MTRNWISYLNRALFGILVSLLCLFIAPQKAEASWAVNMTLDVLDKVNSINDSVPSGTDVKDIFKCLDGNTDTLVCVETYGGEYGETIGTIIDLYEAVNTGEIMPVVSVVSQWLGDDALCTIADIVAPGVGGALCGLAQELIQLGKDIWAFGGSVVGFFKDVGTAIVCIFKDCDTNTPPEIVAFGMMFEPHIQEGFSAIQQDNTAFKNFRKKLVVDANNQELPPPLDSYITSGAINIAADWFTDAVEKVWTGHIIQTVAPAVIERENAYVANRSNQVGETGARAYIENNTDPRKHVENNCLTHFRNYDNANQLARWFNRTMITNDAKTNTIKNNFGPLLPDNWCNWENSNGLWATFKENRFVPAFLSTLDANKICKKESGSVSCDSLSDYRTCVGLMNHVRPDDKEWLRSKCKVDRVKVGNDVAYNMRDYFRELGSTKECIPIPKGPSEPVEYQCGRPTQYLFCKKEYSEFYGNLPHTLLKCTLLESLEYLALKEKAVEGTLALNDALRDHEIEAGLGLTSMYDFYTDHVDPLIIATKGSASFDVATEYNTNENLGFESINPCFANQPPIKYTIDGLSTPTICLVAKDLEKLFREGIKDNLKNPRTEILKKIEDLKAGNITNPAHPGGPNVLPGVEELSKPKVIDRDQIMEPVLDGVQAPQMKPDMNKVLQVPQHKKGMRGTLPSGATLPDISSTKVKKVEPVKRSTILKKVKPIKGSAIVKKAKPDLAVVGRPRIAGVPVNWGGTVKLNANRATRINDKGLCEFPLEYSVRNVGKAASGKFNSVWNNQAAGSYKRSRNWQALPPGAKRNGREVMALRSGLNTLWLKLDDRKQITESNEKNNAKAISIQVIGNCAVKQAKPVPIQKKVAPTLKPKKVIPRSKPKKVAPRPKPKWVAPVTKPKKVTPTLKLKKVVPTKEERPMLKLQQP